MLKAGIFLDLENLTRNGGWGIRYDVIRDLVAAQGTTVLRANAYMAIDRTREDTDYAYRSRRHDYRAAIRRTGFHLILKEVKRYRDTEGELVTKANSDLDLAVDALLQSDNLDYVLLGSGDGDFLRLVRALQNRGKRVDLLSFANTNTQLKREVDFHFSGFLVPNLVRTEEPTNRQRGIMHAVNEERGYGFVTLRTGLQAGEIRDDVFCHITDVVPTNGNPVDNSYFASLKMRQSVLEFDLVDTDDGRVKAINVQEFQW